jgi:hypothetical protein
MAGAAASQSRFPYRPLIISNIERRITSSQSSLTALNRQLTGNRLGHVFAADKLEAAFGYFLLFVPPVALDDHRPRWKALTDRVTNCGKRLARAGRAGSSMDNLHNFR